MCSRNFESNTQNQMEILFEHFDQASEPSID